MSEVSEELEPLWKIWRRFIDTTTMERLKEYAKDEPYSLYILALKRVRGAVEKVDTLESNLSSLSGELAKTQNNVKSLEEKIANIVSELNSLADSIKRIYGEKEDLKARVDALWGAVEELKTSIDRAQGQIPPLYGRIEKVEKEISNIYSSIQSLRDNINRNSAEIRALFDEVSKVRGELEATWRELQATKEALGALPTLERDVDALKDAVNKLYSAISLHETVISSIRRDVDNLAASLGKISMDVENLKNLYNVTSTLSSEVSKIEDSINKIYAVLSRHSEQIKAISDYLSKMSTRIANIEKSIAVLNTHVERISQIEARVENLEKKVDELTAKTKDMDAKLKEISSVVSANKDAINSISTVVSRVPRLEDALSRTSSTVSQLVRWMRDIGLASWDASTVSTLTKLAKEMPVRLAKASETWQDVVSGAMSIVGELNQLSEELNNMSTMVFDKLKKAFAYIGYVVGDLSRTVDAVDKATGALESEFYASLSLYRAAKSLAQGLYKLNIRAKLAGSEKGADITLVAPVRDAVAVFADELRAASNSLITAALTRKKALTHLMDALIMTNRAVSLLSEASTKILSLTSKVSRGISATISELNSIFSATRLPEVPAVKVFYPTPSRAVVMSDSVGKAPEVSVKVKTTSSIELTLRKSGLVEKVSMTTDGTTEEITTVAGKFEKMVEAVEKTKKELQEMKRSVRALLGT